MPFVAAAIPLVLAGLEVIGWGSAIIFSLSLVVGELNRRKAQDAASRARDAYNASLRDQYTMVRGSVTASPIIYGRTRVSGNILYAQSTGNNSDTLWLVVGLCRHQIDAIESVYFDDHLLTLDGSGVVTSAPYTYAPAVGGQVIWSNPPLTVNSTPQNLTHTPNAGSLRLLINPTQWGRTAAAQVVLIENTDYTITGATVTFTSQGISSYGGKSVAVVYTIGGTVSYYAKVYKFLGTTSQAAWADLVSASGGRWTNSHQLKGVAYLGIKLTYSKDCFTNGVPNVSAVVRGKLVYDPRNSTTAWSNNTALCIRDYLTSTFGFNIAAGAVDDATVIATANSCDEQVQLTATPTYQTRYTCDGVIDTGTDRMSNLDTLASSMAGAVYYTQGKWKMRSGAAVSQVLTLDETNLADGTVQIAPNVSRRDLFNSAKGKFLDAANSYQEADITPWASATYLAQDGGVSYPLAVSFPMTTDNVRCQRLAKIKVQQSRYGFSLVAPCNLSMYQAAIGDGVTVSLARYGISAQPFRIVDRQINDKLQVVLTLVEDSSAIYAWNLGEQVLLASPSTLSLYDPRSPGAPVVASISTGDSVATVSQDGTVSARIKIAWTITQDPFILNGGWLEVQYQTTYMSDWQTLGKLDANSAATYLLASPNLWYQVRAKYVNNAGVSSAWTLTDILAIGKTTAPGTPGGFAVTQVNGGMRHFVWSVSSIDPDVTSFELRYVAGSSASWGTMSGLATVTAGSNRLDWAHDSTQPAAAGTYSFAIAAVRGDGTYSSPAYVLGVVLDAVGAVAAASITGQVSDAQIAGMAASKLGGAIASSQIGFGTSGNRAANSNMVASASASVPLAWFFADYYPGHGQYMGKTPCPWSGTTYYGPPSGGGAYMNWPGTWPGTLANNTALGDIYSNNSLDATRLTPVNGYPVEGNAKYEISAWLSTHRCDALLEVGWYDVNGTYISESSAGWSSNNQAPWPTPSNRTGGIVTAPSNAVRCSIWARALSKSGMSDAYCFVAEFNFKAAGSAQNEITAYEPGGQDIVDGGLIAAQTIFAGSIAASTITGDKLNVGSVQAAVLTAGCITAGMITVASLAAITSTLGTIYAGAIYVGNFSMDGSGNLTASNANVSGTITAGYLVLNGVGGSSLLTGMIGANAVTQDQTYSVNYGDNFYAMTPITGVQICQTPNITVDGSTPVLITAAVAAKSTGTSTTHRISLRRSGTSILDSFNLIAPWGPDVYTFLWSETPSSGTYYYELWISAVSGSVAPYAGTRTITALQLKR